MSSDKREDLRVHDAAGGLLLVLEQLADVAAGRTLLHQLEHGGRQLLGQVVDERRRVVGRHLLHELARSPRRSARRAARAPASGPSSLSASIASGCSARRAARTRRGDPFGQLGEDLREVGGMLLLQQIDEVRRRAHAQQALHRVEHDVELALGHQQSQSE